MADKGSSIGQFFGNIGSGLENAGSSALSSVGSLFSGAPSGSQGAQAAIPSINSIGNAASGWQSDLAKAGAAGPAGVSAASIPSFLAAGDEALSKYSGAATSGGGGGGLDIGQAIGKYALPTALMFGGEAMQQGQNKKALSSFKDMEAKQQGIADRSRSLAEAEQGGHLPAGEQLMVQRQLEAARQGIKSKYAELGMSGSSAEEQDLQAANEQAMFQQFQMGQALAGQGFTEAAAGDANATNLMQYIAQTEAAQGSDLASVLGKFAAMFTGTSPGVQ